MSSAKKNGISLHSRYDPRKEASRYIERLSSAQSPGVYILIEPGEGYLSNIILGKFPGSLVLELHCDPEFDHEDRYGSLFSWSPAHSDPLRSFLAEHISEEDIGLLHVVEWKPARELYRDMYDRILKEVMSFLQNERAAIHTTGIFGRKWISNAFHRIIDLPPIQTSAIAPNLPLVIAASGPSLSASLPVLKEHRRSLSIWALPSSLSALLHGGILPDMIIHTDPGFYAQYHLRQPGLAGIPHAAPLTASVAATAPSLLPLNTGTLMESFFFERLSLGGICTPSHGTVAGTAYYAAVAACVPSVIFAGLDLCFEDLHSHCRPHTFEALLQSSTSRIHPLTTVYYERSPRSRMKLPHDSQSTAGGSSEQSFALGRYAEWFSAIPKNPGTHVFRLFPSHIDIPSFRNIGTAAEFLNVFNSSEAVTAAEDSLKLRHIAIEDRIAVLHEYLDIIVNQFHQLRDSGSDILDLPMLKEFISFFCYSELFRLNSAPWKYGRRLTGLDTRLLLRCIEASISQLRTFLNKQRYTP